MPIERHHALVTVAGVNSWKTAGQCFQVRYDLVKLGVKSAAPAYNCVYIVDGREYVLVATNARPSGFIEERKLGLWPGVFKHHDQYGDGTVLVLDPKLQTISTWRINPNGVSEISTIGQDCTESGG